MTFIPSNVALLVGTFNLAWVLHIVTSRVLFHPLKSFPGPRLAAITELYAAYYEVWKGGLLVKHLEDLHRVYGPVIRIRPNELHFSTPQAYFAIYPAYSGFTKDPTFYSCFGVDEASFTLINVKDHKTRRDLLGPLFSRRAIVKFERKVQDIIDLFLENLRTYRDIPINFKLAFRSLTMDVITTYSFGYSLDGVSAPAFDHPITASLHGAVKLSTASRYLPILRALKHLPATLARFLNANAAGYHYFLDTVSANVDKHLMDPDSVRKADQETIYHHLLPESVDRSKWPSKASLVDEALSLLAAGTDTTSNALVTGLYHLLKQDNEAIRKRLENELIMAWPEKDSPFSYEQAEKLPYLTGFIKESLRLSTGVPIPLPRVVGSPITIDGVQVPVGTVVSCSAQFILRNQDVFRDPDEFSPERWMQPNSTVLDKHFVAFSRGPRSCVAMNLAWCELYLTFSHLVRKFEMNIYDTSLEDMELRAYMTPSWLGRGLRAVVRERSF